MSSDLAAWLLEQIAEDERQLLDGDPAHQWHSGGCHAWMSAANRPCSCGATERLHAECDAKRKVLNEHRTRDSVHLVEEGAPVPVHSDPSCRGCGFGGDEEPRTAHVNECPTLRALALSFVGRPGYCEEWRPS
jgi:hypothetical protein